MACNFKPFADPHVVKSADVVEQSSETGGAAGVTNHSCVQPD